jgi:hypothetical protein
VIIVALSVLCLALIAVLIFAQERARTEREAHARTLLTVLTQHSQETTERASAYERTLQSMADRIQRPEILPLRDTSDFVVPDPEPDEWNKVGELDIDENYGLADEEPVNVG